MVQDVDVIVRDSKVILSLVAAKEYYIGCELEGPGVPVVYDEGPQICRPQHETWAEWGGNLDDKKKKKGCPQPQAWENKWTVAKFLGEI